MIHSTRTLLEDKENVMMQLDLKNAYNSVKWEYAYQEMVKRNYTTLAQYMKGVYGNEEVLITALDNGDVATVTRSTGVAQGDVLAPYIFSLVIDETIKKIHEECNIVPMAYLDDIILVGKPEEVCQAARRMYELLRQHRTILEISWSKTRIYAPHHQEQDVETMIEDLGVDIGEERERIRAKHGTVLLGTPIGETAFEEEMVKQKVEDISSEKCIRGSLRSSYPGPGPGGHGYHNYSADGKRGHEYPQTTETNEHSRGHGKHGYVYVPPPPPHG